MNLIPRIIPIVVYKLLYTFYEIQLILYILRDHRNVLSLVCYVNRIFYKLFIKHLT